MRVARIVHLYRRRLGIDFWHEFCAAITVVSPNGRAGLGVFPPADRVMSKKTRPKSAVAVVPADGRFGLRASASIPCGRCS